MTENVDDDDDDEEEEEEEEESKVEIETKILRFSFNKSPSLSYIFE